MKFKEILLWAACALITIFALFGTYGVQLAGPVTAIIWLGWAVASLALVYFTELGARMFTFAKEAKYELDKVVWPNRQETTQTTLIVIAMVTVTGFVLWGLDAGIVWVVGKITQLA